MPGVDDKGHDIPVIIEVGAELSSQKSSNTINLLYYSIYCITSLLTGEENFCILIAIILTYTKKTYVKI
jgi:hypothetical protein